LLSKNIRIKTYETTNFSVVLYGCEVWPMALKEEHGQGAFDKRIVREISGPKGD
jgi:hypothetical protein